MSLTTDTPTIRAVSDRRQLARFIDFPYRHYAREPVWVPPFRRDVEALLSRTRNPFFEHGEAEYFLAERDGRTVGRIAAIHNRLHNETHGDRVGFFGFFETIDDPAVAQALLDSAAGWCRQRGLDRLRGPASFSVNDECGLLVENFTDPPTLMMPYNPPWYVPLVEKAGFANVQDLRVYQGGSMKGGVPTPERVQRATEIMKKRMGVTIRPLDLRRFGPEVELLKRLYNASWEKNWGFVPMTDHEIDHAAAQFKPVVIPVLTPFVECRGEPIGFALALPDLNVSLRSNRSGRLLPAALKLMWDLKMHNINRCRILLLGVIPEYRGKGIDAMLYDWIWSRAREIGYTWGEAGWILEDNPMMQRGLEKMGFEMYRKYRMYERAIG